MLSVAFEIPPENLFNLSKCSNTSALNKSKTKTVHRATSKLERGKLTIESEKTALLVQNIQDLHRMFGGPSPNSQRISSQPEENFDQLVQTSQSNLKTMREPVKFEINSQQVFNSNQSPLFGSYSHCMSGDGSDFDTTKTFQQPQQQQFQQFQTAVYSMQAKTGLTASPEINSIPNHQFLPQMPQQFQQLQMLSLGQPATQQQNQMSLQQQSQIAIPQQSYLVQQTNMLVNENPSTFQPQSQQHQAHFTIAMQQQQQQVFHQQHLLQQQQQQMLPVVAPGTQMFAGYLPQGQVAFTGNRTSMEVPVFLQNPAYIPGMPYPFFRGDGRKEKLAPLPPRWLNADILQAFSIDHQHYKQTGKLKFNTDVIEKGFLYHFLKRCKYPHLTPKQYRAALRKLVFEDRTTLDKDFRELLINQIDFVGRSHWGFKRYVSAGPDLPEFCKEQKLVEATASKLSLFVADALAKDQESSSKGKRKRDDESIPKLGNKNRKTTGESQ